MNTLPSPVTMVPNSSYATTRFSAWSIWVGQYRVNSTASTSCFADHSECTQVCDAVHSS